LHLWSPVYFEQMCYRENQMSGSEAVLIQLWATWTGLKEVVVSIPGGLMQQRWPYKWQNWNICIPAGPAKGPLANRQRNLKLLPTRLHSGLSAVDKN
jgi:hypothetical protein